MKIENKLDELYRKSLYLRTLAFSVEDYETSVEIREKQDELYKRWLFYKNFIKARNKVNKIQGGKYEKNKN